MSENEEQLPLEVTPRIVEGVLVSANTGELGSRPKSNLALIIEKAMSDTVQAHYDAGIHDPDTIKEAMHDARDKVLAWHDEEMAKAVPPVV